MLRSVVVVACVAAVSGCSTPSMLAWRGIDDTLGPFGTVNHRRHAGVPVDEQRDVVLVPLAPAPVPEPEPPPEPAPVPDVVVVPTPPGPPAPVAKEPPEIEGPVAEPSARGPVGPSVATLPMRFECEARQRAEADRLVPYVQPVAYWLYLPTFFASASLLPLAVFGAASTADALEAKDSVPRSWVMAGMIAPAAILVLADVIGGALIAYGQPTTPLEAELVAPLWVSGRTGCADIVVEHGELRFAVRPDGSLDAWDEAYLVDSIVRDPRPLVIHSDGAVAALPVTLDTRCALARDRGYPEPARCPRTLAPTTAGARLPVQPWRPR